MILKKKKIKHHFDGKIVIEFSPLFLGQSDIRKLRRENELLRREIWTLRDEYDRLDKLLHDHRVTKGEEKEKNGNSSNETSGDSEVTIFQFHIS